MAGATPGPHLYRYMNIYIYINIYLTRHRPGSWPGSSRGRAGLGPNRGRPSPGQGRASPPSPGQGEAGATPGPHIYHQAQASALARVEQGASRVRAEQGPTKPRVEQAHQALARERQGPHHGHIHTHTHISIYLSPGHARIHQGASQGPRVWKMKIRTWSRLKKGSIQSNF